MRDGKTFCNVLSELYVITKMDPETKVHMMSMIDMYFQFVFFWN